MNIAVRRLIMEASKAVVLLYFRGTACARHLPCHPRMVGCHTSARDRLNPWPIVPASNRGSTCMKRHAGPSLPHSLCPSTALTSPRFPKLATPNPSRHAHPCLTIPKRTAILRPRRLARRLRLQFTPIMRHGVRQRERHYTL